MPRSPYPSGWYCDVTQVGRQRFWNGSSWSDQTRNVPAQDLATHTHATVGKRLWCAVNNSPRFTAVWTWLKILLLGVAVLGLLITLFRIYKDPGSPTGSEPALMTSPNSAAANPPQLGVTR